MTEDNLKKLIEGLNDALGGINSAECAFIREKDTDNPIAVVLSRMWYDLYQVRKLYKEGLESKSNQSKGEPEKTG